MEKEEEIIEEEQAKTTSLFPVFHHQQTPLQTSTVATAAASEQWLCNSSFTTDLSVINDAVSKYDQPYEEDEEEDKNKSEKINSDKLRSQYELVDTPVSDKSSSSSDREKRKKKKKKKRKRENGRSSSYDYAATFSSSTRKPDVKKWANSSTSSDKEYYFDSHGDRDNLAFGSLYRMDMARYKLYNSKKISDHNYLLSNQRFGGLEGENEIDALGTTLRSGVRYWSAKYSALERHKNLKRVRIFGQRKPISSSGADYIPLLDEENTDLSFLGATVVEESWEDEVLRKTKEFNVLTREHPQDESIWLAFADFQDKVANMQPHKGARLQILEKKISILEKATELNPDSEDLLLSLMNAYRSRDSTDALIGRWQKILTQNSGSFKLWREFLHVVQGEFSRFKVSDVRKMYGNAIQAMAGACSKQHRQKQVHQSFIAPSIDPAVVDLELGLVDVFLSLCRFEWQSGYQELATALFQSEIEYSLFCPSLVLSEQSKQRLFKHFWSSNGARVGEDGALGWSTWLEKEEEQRQRLISEESSNDVEKGGWTGWFEPLSNQKETSEIAASTTENDMAFEESDHESEMINIEQKDDIEALLKKVGIDAAAEADSQIKDTKIWTRWSKAELERDSEQWMPIRAKSDQISRTDGTSDMEDDEQLLRVILYEDVSDYLFSLNSMEARLSLVAQFIDFYEGRISKWACTNSSSWAEKTLSLETLPYSIIDSMRRVHNLLVKNQDNPTTTPLELLLSSSDDTDMRSNAMKFLRNATLLCLTAFPQNYILQEAALIAEELSNTKMNRSVSSVTPCRGLARMLLKNNRQDVLLCGVYARREALFGNIDNARKVFDMALSSIEGLPLEVRPNASILYFWYAEVELGNSTVGNSDSVSRAMHILSCLGSGAQYNPFKCQPSSLLQLRARQGFKDRIKMLRPTWTCGMVDDHSVALICSAALFEKLTAGLAAAFEILEDAFTMVLPERRRQSYQLESLFEYYVRMLCENHAEWELAKVWEAIRKGLQMYPSNPNLYSALTEISKLHTSPNKLRWIFDDYCHKMPSVVTWLYSLSFEMSRGGAQHRIRGLFERALENDKLRISVILWRCYIEYEMNMACNPSAARRVFFRAIHACPWSKKLWLDGFLKLNSILTVKELSDLQEVMRDKELNLRTDIYEILLQDEAES
ncbi:NRDE2 homolog isoform X1 [Olea europaea subsp. europaea]|uniref:NRDE2 homolog isoform X1 n=2 Tax=Olea europaea subsp. europaea TaxID=158383 RepID=A0A8S0PDN7_OLEEU|nr:NRDE2 homolog isoform X1 [Olea europaea subsp. europaea]